MEDSRPLIMHVIYHMGVGGLENGLVNIINRMDPSAYRHIIVSLTGATDFVNRLKKDDVQVITLQKRPGNDLNMYWRLFKLFKQYRPALVHTRNLAALEAQLFAFLAGVPARVHGEHGWDIHDIDGANKKYRMLKKLFRLFVSRYIVLSEDLERYLTQIIKVDPVRITRIINGVDTERFNPKERGGALLPAGLASDDSMVIGYVGRLETVKDPMNLLHAFRMLVAGTSAYRKRARLVIVGGGSLNDEIHSFIDAEQLGDYVWLAGSRDDIPELMRSFDVFVLPSLAEGISNTIMEAMASGLPVIATQVGGNAELVEDRKTGYMVPAADPQKLADSIKLYLDNPALLAEHGAAARQVALERFDINMMVETYHDVYDGLLKNTNN